MKKHNPRESLIGKAISDAVSQLPQNDPDVDPCIVGKGGCFLSAGIEHLFVALSAKAFVEHDVNIAETDRLGYAAPSVASRARVAP